MLGWRRRATAASRGVTAGLVGLAGGMRHLGPFGMPACGAEVSSPVRPRRLRLDQRLGLAEDRLHIGMVGPWVDLQLLAELIEPRTGLVAVTEAVMRHREKGEVGRPEALIIDDVD